MAFEVVSSPLSGLLIIQPQVLRDYRGFFFEASRASEFVAAGIDAAFVQENQSLSSRGVLRGIHFQTGIHAQGKLVRAISGSIWDVAVDLRPRSATFGRWFGLEISVSNRTMVYLPPGFGHATLAMSETAEVVYQCTAEYHPESECGIRWDDPTLGIEWPAVDCEYLLSEKDRALPSFRESHL